jgi:sugar/nucleoside kinase (ribokinase family)
VAASDRVDVVCVGMALADLVVEADDDALEGLGLTKGTMRLVDEQTAEALVARLGEPTVGSGGSAANSAVGVAMLGGRAGFVGCVADDALGRAFAADLAARGVAFARVGSGGGSPTGRCVVVVTPDGERTMCTFLGASVGFGPGDLGGDAASLVERGAVVLIEGYLFDAPTTRQAALAAAQIAHGCDGLVALGLSDRLLVERHRRALLEFLRDHADIVVGNAEEATALFAARSHEQAARAFDEAGVLAAITDGARGTVVVGPSGRVEVPGVTVARVVDTTGAGDLFAAGFLLGLVRGLGPEDAASVGNRAAAAVVGVRGARPPGDLKGLFDHVRFDSAALPASRELGWSR